MRQTVQLTNAHFCRIETHTLTGCRVRVKQAGEGVILGKRVGIDARRRHAFVIKHGNVVRLISPCGLHAAKPKQGIRVI